MSEFASRNRRVHFLLVVVDQFTKKLFVAPCKQKNQTDVLNAFRDIFERQTMSRPRIIYSDNGKEFLNSAVSHYLQSIHVQHSTTNDSSIKGAIVERTNQTLKRKLVKIASLHTASISIICKTSLSDSTTPYTPQHDSHPTPSIPSPSTRLESTSKKPSFDDRKNTPSGTNAPTAHCCMSVTDVDTHDLPPVYKLHDLRQEPVIGTFQYPELVHVTFPASFKITKSRLRQQTVVDLDTGARTRWVQIRIAEYWDSLWLPERRKPVSDNTSTRPILQPSRRRSRPQHPSQSDTFANRPYGDVQFDPRFTWNTALINAFLTHTSTLDMSSKLWYKRFYLPEKLSTTAGSAFEKVYKGLTAQKWLHHQNYARVLDAAPCLQPHPSVAYRLVHQHQIAYPTDLESFLTLCYTDYLHPYKEYYNTFTDGKTPVKTSSMFGIKKNTNTAVVHDCFDIVARRSNAADSSIDRFARNASFALSEGSYQQIVRLPRSLADLLNIDWWEWRQSADVFPYCPPTATSTADDIMLTNFNADTWFNESRECTLVNGLFKRSGHHAHYTVQPGGAEGAKLNWCQRSFAMRILKKSWIDDAPYDPNRSSKKQKTLFSLPRLERNIDLLTAPTATDDDDDYVDIAITTRFGPVKYPNTSVTPLSHFDDSQKLYNDPRLYCNLPLAWVVTIPPPQFTSINSKYFPRGTSFVLSLALRHLGVQQMVKITTNKIESNIYSGIWEPTIAILHLPTGAQKLSSKFTKNWYEFDTPIFNKVVPLADSTFVYRLTSRSSNSLLHLLTKLSPVALAYYNEHSFSILHNENYPTTLTFFFRVS
eukprot:gene4376-biopygen3563